MGNNEQARIRWRCRRGLLELDLLLSNFVDQHYRHLDINEQAAFQQLLDLPDPTLVDVLLMGAAVPDEIAAGNIVKKIRQTSEN